MMNLRTSVYTVSVLYVLSFSACVGDDDDFNPSSTSGIITEMQYVWKTQMTKNSDLIYESIDSPPIYGNNVILPYQDGNSEEIVSISSLDGSIAWHWRPMNSRGNGSRVTITDYHQNDKLLTFVLRPNNVYTIDLRTGSIIADEILDASWIRRIGGQGNTYYLTGETFKEEFAGNITVIYFGDQNVLESSELTRPNSDYALHHEDEKSLGQIGDPHVLEINGKSNLAYSFGDNKPNWMSAHYVALYDLEAGEYVYDRIPIDTISDLYANGPQLIHEGLGYIVSDEGLNCYNIANGKIIWRKAFSAGPFISNIIVEDEVLLYLIEDTYLYGLDPLTGEQLWREKASGTSSHMVALNGVVYFVGGGDGLLHAVEIETGKHLWKIVSPDLATNSDAWFARQLAVFPPQPGEEKGRVVVMSFLNAFAFEAAR